MNQRELNTVLAALRLWQSGVHHPLELEVIATNDGESEPLDGEEIDALCERLNCGEDEPFRAAIEKALRALSCEGEYSHLQNRSSGEQIDEASAILSEARANRDEDEDESFRGALQGLHDAIGRAADAGNWGAQALDNCPEIIAARGLLMEGA